jgi:hypothetical protein
MRRPTDEALSGLKRSLLRLSLLDGRLVWCAEGPHLTWPQAVTEPLALLDELGRHGSPTVAGLARATRMSQPPQAVTARWLGAAQRDLKALRHPAALGLVAEASRVFRRHGRVDAAWLDARQQALDALTAQLTRGAPEGQAALYALAEALHGPGAATALEELEARSRAHGRSRRAEGRRRLDALVARLAPDPRPMPGEPCEVPGEVLEGFAREVLQADRARGRPFERRLRRAVQALVSWPAPPVDAARDAELAPLPSALEAAVRAAGEEALAARRASTHHEAPERLGRAVGVLGLLFRAGPGDRLTPADVSLVLRGVEPLQEHLAGKALTVRQVVELLRLDKQHGQHEHGLLAALGALVAGGLELPLVSELLRVHQGSGLIVLEDDVEAARTWGQWVLRLAPTMKKSGHALHLMASAFKGISRGRAGGLVLLGRCLLSQDATENLQTLLAWLDATLGLVRAAPEQARTLYMDLMGTEPGLGRALFPDFAAWLGDDALLDRFCYLQRLAGEPPSLPHALLRDFSRADKRQRERERLSALGNLTDAQRSRLERLVHQAPLEEPPTPDWTVRRLKERVDAAQVRAFEARLDATLAAVLHAGWGIRLERMTPEWRDAVRFQLATDDNKELLGTLLRYAAAQPGRPLVRAMAANAPWLKRAAKRMDVGAWLAPRATEVELQGRRYVLSVEQDPLQVLRMGIPFDTCLSLENGGNAAATVLNALDANKRVLYLRDEDGAIVARKLLAVSREWTLLGYRLYVALEPELRPDVARAFHAFCVALASGARLPLADSGVPESLHPGFWYDDGTVPFTGPEPVPASDATEAYCRHLGRTLGGMEGLQHEAAVWSAHRRGDVAATLAALQEAGGLEVELEAALWLIEKLGEAESLRLTASHPMLATALLHRAFTPDAERLMALLARWPQVRESHWEDVVALLNRARPSEAALRQLVDLARRHLGRSSRSCERGLEHGTMTVLPSRLARLEVAAALELCERVAPVWDGVVARTPGCDSCREKAWSGVLDACVRAYARRPDPAAVVRCLEDGRGHKAVHRVALHLAARFPFPRSLRAPAPAPAGLTWLEGAPLGCPAALRVLRERGARNRELAALPEFTAALLRQSGTGVPVPPESLPVPASAPFEALADLQLHLPGPTRALLSRWDGVPAERRVSTWTLYFHRRHATTAWRRALLRAGPERLRSQQGWLAVLGDAAGLQEAFEPPPSEPETGPSLPSYTEGRRDSQRLARLVARQVAAAEEGGEPPRKLEGNAPPEAVDPAVMRRALHLLELGTRPGAPAAVEAAVLEGCIDVLVQGHTPGDFWVALLEQLLDRGAPEPLVARAVLGTLYGVGPSLPEGLEELLVRAVGMPEARRHAVEVLSGLDASNWVGCHARLLLAARARGVDIGGFLDALCAGWARRFVGSDRPFMGCWLPPELREGLERAAVAQGARVSLRLYESLPGSKARSRFLDRMLATLPADALRAELDTPPDGRGAPELPRTWLAAALSPAA